MRAENLGAPIVAIGIANFAQLAANHLQQPVVGGENVLQVGDLLQNALVVFQKLVLLQRGQALQTQVENCLGLLLREVIEPVPEPELIAEAIGPAGVTASTRQQLLDTFGHPAAAHERGASFSRRRGVSDQLDDHLDVSQRHGLALDDMAALTRPAQQVDGAAGNDFLAVLYKGFEHLLEVEHPRLTIDQRHAVDAKNGLQLSLRVQIIEHDLAGFAAPQLDNDTHTVFVGFIPQLGDALDLLFLDQLGNAFDQPGLIQLIRQLRNDDGVLVRLVITDNLSPGTHINTPATGTVRLHDAGAAVDNGRGWKIGPLNVLHEPVNADIRVVQQRQAAIYHLPQIVRRDVGGHARRRFPSCR